MKCSVTAWGQKLLHHQALQQQILLFGGTKGVQAVAHVGLIFRSFYVWAFFRLLPSMLILYFSTGDAQSNFFNQLLQSHPLSSCGHDALVCEVSLNGFIEAVNTAF